MTTPRLFLSTVSDDFRPGVDRALGPWCFVGRETNHPGWEDLEFPEPITDAETLLAEAMRARRTANARTRRLADEMNHRHGLSRSPEYWRYLILPWALSLTQLSWKTWLRLQEARRLWGESPLEVAVAELQTPWDFSDTDDFSNRGFARIDFHFWVASRLLLADLPGAWRPTEVSLTPAAPPSLPTATSWKRRLARAVLPHLRFPGIAVSPAARLFFSWALALLPGQAQPLSETDTDTDVSDSEIPKDFSLALDHLLRDTMPGHLGAGYRKRAERAEGLRYKPGRRTIYAGGLWYNEEDKFRAATALEAGERIVGLQHGGLYGMARSFPDACEIEYRQHSFITWGWAGHSGHQGRFVPLPSPSMSGFVGRYRPVSDSLILVGTEQRILSSRLDALPQPGQWLEIRKRKRSFVHALAPGPRAALRYRPGKEDGVACLEDASDMLRSFPGLPMIAGKLHREILGCRLLALDHPGTTLNIAVAAGIPTVCFWRERHWPCCPEAAPHLEALRQTGILHESEADAAAHVNAIWPDPMGWWKSPTVVEAVEMFRRDHARTARNWWWHWLRALPGL